MSTGKRIGAALAASTALAPFMWTFGFPAAPPGLARLTQAQPRRKTRPARVVRCRLGTSVMALAPSARSNRRPILTLRGPDAHRRSGARR